MWVVALQVKLRKMLAEKEKSLVDLEEEFRKCRKHATASKIKPSQHRRRRITNSIPWQYGSVTWITSSRKKESYEVRIKNKEK